MPRIRRNELRERQDELRHLLVATNITAPDEQALAGLRDPHPRSLAPRQRHHQEGPAPSPGRRDPRDGSAPGQTLVPRAQHPHRREHPHVGGCSYAVQRSGRHLSRCKSVRVVGPGDGCSACSCWWCCSCWLACLLLVVVVMVVVVVGVLCYDLANTCSAVVLRGGSHVRRIPR